MRRWIFLMLLILLIPQQAYGVEYSIPSAPESAQQLMPKETESFAQGLWEVVRNAVSQAQPALVNAGQVCLGMFAVTLLISMVNALPGNTKNITELVGTLSIAWLLLQPSNVLIHLGADTVQELSDYGKLLLPVMTAAMAAQGGSASSAAMYVGTAFFDAVLCSLINKFIVPMIYVFICLAVAGSAIGEPLLEKLRELVKWLMTWGLKIILYIFTGYMGITGVVSGAADASALKAAKLTISGMVPVVGGILSDASEAVLVGAGVFKSAAGVYGVLAILAVFAGPFVEIGVQYLLLKLTAAVCAVYGTKRASDLIQNFTSAMGMLLAMTGASCLLLLISTVCLMKEVG